MPRSVFMRPELHQVTTSKGAIIHLTSTSTSRDFVLDIAKRQREAGYNVGIVHFKDPVRSVTPEFRVTPSIADMDGIPYREFSFEIPQRTEDMMSAVGQYFWNNIVPSELQPSIIHAHGVQAGIIAAKRPANFMTTPTLFTFAHINPEEADAAVSVIGKCNATYFWSEAHHADITQPGRPLAAWVKNEEGMGKFYPRFGTSWMPDDQYLPNRYLWMLNLAYNRLVYGSGMRTVVQILDLTPQKVANLLYNDQSPRRAEIAWRAFVGNPTLRDTFQHITAYAWETAESPENPNLKNMPWEYTYTLGTLMFLVKKGVEKLNKQTPIVILLNNAGLSTRETPVVQVTGAKGLLIIGNATMNEMVAAQTDAIVKQLPPGEWEILTGSDNVGGGRLTVGDHSLSEDRHGWFNLVRIIRVSGTGAEIPGNLAELGVSFAHTGTGARLHFEEKRPPSSVIANAEKFSKGFAALNTMIKIIRKDIARMLSDGEHFGRPSYKDPNQSLLAAYSDVPSKGSPDWSKHIDEPTIHSLTLKKWMKRWDNLKARETDTNKETPYSRHDWRLLWIVSNDIALQSLQEIALEERYFGGLPDLAKEEWVAVNRASIGILTESASFNDDVNNDHAPKHWYFRRNQHAGLLSNWKEAFLAAVYIKHEFGVNSRIEWERRKPADVSSEKWSAIWNVSLRLDEKENGIAVADMEGCWLDTGEKEQFTKVCLEVVDQDPALAQFIRRISSVPTGQNIELSVQGQDHLIIRPGSNVFVGSGSVFSCPNGGKIELSNNVVITKKSVIQWMGQPGEILRIPENTAICMSTLRDIDPTIQDASRKLIYNYHQQPGKPYSYQIDTPTGKKRIGFGFYGGTCWVSFELDDGKIVSTCYPLSLNVRDQIQYALLETILNDDLRFHFQKFYSPQSGSDRIRAMIASGKPLEVYSCPIPFIDGELTAAELGPKVVIRGG